MIETEYTITSEDYNAAQQLYLRHRPAGMVVYVVTQWVIPALAVCGVGWFLALWLSQSYRRLPLVGGITAGLLWASFGFVLSRKVAMRRGYRNVFPQRVPRITRLTVDDQQVISAIPGRSEGRFYWSAIEDYAENEQIALMFVRRRLFLMVPHRALNEAQWSELRALVAEKREPAAQA